MRHSKAKKHEEAKPETAKKQEESTVERLQKLSDEDFAAEMEAAQACACADPVEEELPAEPEGGLEQEQADEERIRLEEENKRLQDQLLRTLAEYDNFRKRTQREKDQLYSDSLTDVVSSWLPLIDNLDRAIVAAERELSEKEEVVVEGIRMIQRQSHEILTKLGVEEIPALGQTFDPQLHHAVLQVEDEAAGEQEIVEVFEPGYRRGERIIRPSVVKVANC